MGGILTATQYRDLSPAAQKLLADYFSANMANFANMKSSLGTVPRNPGELEMAIKSVPLPYIGWQAAQPGFENFRGELMRRTAGHPEIYQPPKQ